MQATRTLFVIQAWTLAAGRLASLHEALALRRRRAAARREFQALGADTLRDLALGPAEFDSCWAESHGEAAPTRRRIADPIRVERWP
ncbi:hypothetical protein [Ramlibacter rhizophilus]|uniref:DUF1127 domain-containing protein n=1 Tax=Ramlibacter rhizophilus TaxID=1781167 RepID=A0A4Z0BI98_9BURK|nr:hypothetical protein [Ramlibacter rhizophilus]TFY98500.1 hypothetical protein EZ242_13225 [Ramlibacter rhizophilus]